MAVAEKIKGGAQELGGKIKEGLGHAMNDPQMVKEAREDQIEGDVRQKAADADTAAKGTWDQVKGRVKSTVGAATGDRSLEGDGKLDELKGKIEKKVAGM